MIRHRLGTIAVAGIFAVGLATAGSVHATTPDETFTDAVQKLGIPIPAGADVPALGHQVCDMLKTGLDSNPNTVPTVRGVVQFYQNNGLERRQAVGLMQASVWVYCPEYSRIIGR
jgi:Protein of unknown function (DUF732)